MAARHEAAVVPGRWQMAVEGGPVLSTTWCKVNIGPKGKGVRPYIFSLFSFILVSNLLGLLPLSVIPGLHAFTTTSHSASQASSRC
jgi:F-type H+-transporting ATPase subunit a